MQLIRQTKLFFKEGNSDKVYEIDLCALTATAFLVNFRYGKRGSALKEGTKTPTALTIEGATRLFEDLEREKKNKGYREELQMTIILPVLDSSRKDTPENIMLLRLQDAAKGTCSFSTPWKTSRVIWKAGQMQLLAAVPFILFLANKGDAFQLHAALWSLARLRSEDAAPLFSGVATDRTQPDYIRNVARVGWMATTDLSARKDVLQHLMESLPSTVRTGILEENTTKLLEIWGDMPAAAKAAIWVPLYLLGSFFPFLLPLLRQEIKDWDIAPPYFKTVRALYKLSQLQNDAATNSIIAYLLEKTPAFYKPKYTLSSHKRHYNEQIGDYITVAEELRSENSRLAFSHHTKAYLQKNALQYLHDLGKYSGARMYLQFAVGLLLQYRQDDYTAAEEKPLNAYGRFNYRDGKYYYELFRYPECATALLLSSVLYGNDKSRKLSSALKIYSDKRTVRSSHYFYREQQVENVDRSYPTETPASFPGFIDTALQVLKGWLGRKKTVPAVQEETGSPSMPGTEQLSAELMLYPQHWRAMPEAYIQLLMEAKMDLILEFAYRHLKQHPDCNKLQSKLDTEALLRLLKRSSRIASNFGWELLQAKLPEIRTDARIVAAILDTDNEDAVLWSRHTIAGERTDFFRQADFVTAFIFNSKICNNEWILQQLQSAVFSEDFARAILGKTVATLLHAGLPSYSDEFVITVAERLNIIASGYYKDVSWDIIEQLTLSASEANKVLAGQILTVKSASGYVPLHTLQVFLDSELEAVRATGLNVLKTYSITGLKDQLYDLLPFTQTHHTDVLDVILGQLDLVVQYDTQYACFITRHLLYDLTRKEKSEMAHSRFAGMMRNSLKPYWSKALRPKDVTRLVHSQYREGQLLGYDILLQYPTDTLTIGQLVSFGSHELLLLREFVWNYFKEHTERIREEKEKALGMLDAGWEDTRKFAFDYFINNFDTADWNADTLIAIVDSIRPDVEQFGKELITRHFQPEYAEVYLSKLSEHPSIQVQQFVSVYLSVYAQDNPEMLQQLLYYFRSVLTRVNKGRVAKDRIYAFLRREGLNNITSAAIIVPLLNDISAQQSVQDKATCLAALTALKTKFPDLAMSLTIKQKAI